MIKFKLPDLDSFIIHVSTKDDFIELIGYLKNNKICTFSIDSKWLTGAIWDNYKEETCINFGKSIYADSTLNYGFCYTDWYKIHNKYTPILEYDTLMIEEPKAVKSSKPFKREVNISDVYNNMIKEKQNDKYSQTIRE